ncbi:MAG: DUF1214 domain-containing protein [Acidimicrobiia bacterium]
MSGSEPTSIEPTSIELRAWSEFCSRLDAVGASLLAEPFPADASVRAEGFDHLADQVLCWLGWAVGYPDARRPFFMRQNDLVTQWGGPNADNVYRHARIDPALRYRIRGRMHACEEFILAMRAGFMHQEKWGTLAEHNASDLGIVEGADFEILLGGDGTEPGWLPIPDGAVMCSIREYYFDWRELEPAMFTIECLDGPDHLPRVGAEDFAAKVDDAARGVERSMEYWNRYMLDERALRDDNSFRGSFALEKGLAAARYGFCFWDLGPDDALVIETEIPDARYWSVQLYPEGWFELADPVERITSLNDRQTRVSDDGRLRFVVSHRDPGVDNWLDAGGRQRGLCTLRWFWPASDAAPDPQATLVGVDEVWAHLPADTVRVAPGERAEVLAARRRHLAWRFRT